MTIHTVKLYKSNNDCAYIQGDEGQVWDLGTQVDDFADDAAAWVCDEWEPGVAHGQWPATFNGLTLVATWTFDQGIRLHVDPEHVGFTQREYLGLS